ncbi:MAG: alpha/beta fold hydrolase [Desulfobulbaceae bacterium]|nr:alpha/beta fold hydrolase [Desulfobulbaceae bacterium]
MGYLFLHGLDSSSRGHKGRYFKEHFPFMLTPDFQGDLKERMAQLYRIVAGDDQLVLVGSSFGGLMATIFGLQNPERVRRLILLAPALNYHDVTGYGVLPLSTETHVYIGDRDVVTPIADVQPLVCAIFCNYSFHRLGDDHMLAKTFLSIKWEELIGGPSLDSGQ